MKRWQWVIIFIWAGLPLLLLIVLNFLSPGYISAMFDDFPPGSTIPGLTWFLAVDALTFIVTFFGFMLMNRNTPKRKVKNEDNPERLSCGTMLFLTLTFFFCAAPS